VEIHPPQLVGRGPSARRPVDDPARRKRAAKKREVETVGRDIDAATPIYAKRLVAIEIK
jgi:hypothetical protein